MMLSSKALWSMFLVISITNDVGVIAFSPLSLLAKGQRSIPSLRAVKDEASTPLIQSEQTLPLLFPTLAPTLIRLGFSSPTPIQSASAVSANADNNNLLLIAPTGSGKTLAYLLPALTKAILHDGTVLVVAPTRELAAQLQRDTVAILGIDDPDTAMEAVVLAVRGILPPTDISNAAVLIGTPVELLHVLTNVKGGREFVAGDTLRAIVLDEVDVLLPLAPKVFRTSLDSKGEKSRKPSNSADMERRRQQEEKQKLALTRKLNAAKRAGTELTSDNKQIVVPTERLLRLIATSRIVAGGSPPPQILAGSATASRRTLDRLNRAMRAASAAANVDFETIWAKDVIVCRPQEEVDETDPSSVVEDEEEVDDEAREAVAQQHTIRAVTVPSQVSHRYISLTKESASSADAVLAAVAKAAAVMKPRSALVFLCGEFAKSNVKSKEIAKPLPKGKTSEARRNSKREIDKKAMAMMASTSRGSNLTPAESVLSARKTCDILGSYGIEAQPLHVALGLEQNAKDVDDDQEEPPPFLVTFEGSARGLHFDAVDAVFVLGRPSSAASYLHLAGRVGRSSTSDSQDGGVVINPGTVVSLCTKGAATELEKWTKQIGGTDLQELVL